jgi:RNA polymerase sigma factor (sigma-70 family)
MIEELYERERERLTSRLERMVGSRELAEDLGQEAFLRVWQRAPDDLSAGQRSTWLNHTASNLAIDELRRRRRRPTADLDVEELRSSPDEDSLNPDLLSAREALGHLTPHERMVLLLRFEAGWSYAEIGAVLDRSAEAARKRVERARQAFVSTLRGVRTGRPPVVVLATTDDRDAYRAWLESAGAEVRVAEIENGGMRAGEVEGELAFADALVVAGSTGDLHPRLYGEAPRGRLGDPSLGLDIRELRLLAVALRLDIPVLGICRGHQLLNVAFGGSLYQDLGGDGATQRAHRGHAHQIELAGGTRVRSLFGRRREVSSEHHQAARRVGRALCVSAVADDGVVEGIELPHRKFVVGLQWPPLGSEGEESGRRVAEALVEAASA